MATSTFRLLDGSWVCFQIVLHFVVLSTRIVGFPKPSDSGVIIYKQPECWFFSAYTHIVYFVFAFTQIQNSTNIKQRIYLQSLHPIFSADLQYASRSRPSPIWLLYLHELMTFRSSQSMSEIVLFGSLAPICKAALLLKVFLGFAVDEWTTPSSRTHWNKNHIFVEGLSADVLWRSIVPLMCSCGTCGMFVYIRSIYCVIRKFGANIIEEYRDLRMLEYWCYRISD